MRSDERRSLRVLAADDSAVMRGVLRTLFELHANDDASSLPEMELCEVVADGFEALEAITRWRPDVLLLDLEMPRLNGLEVLEQLRTVAPSLPVIMCSAYTERGARQTLDALSRGAKDYVMKPERQKDFGEALEVLRATLLPKITALASHGRYEWLDSAGARTEGIGSARSLKPVSDGRAGRSGAELAAHVEVVVIGLSTGGPMALEELLPLFPENFAVPILIVQHMPKLFTRALADRLNGLCKMRVAQAWESAAVEPGTVWLAPGDAHMEVARGEPEVDGRPVISLHQRAPLNHCRPSVDYLFFSAARMFGAGTLALVMTGMGSDGLEGSKAVRWAGGSVLAQDEATSAVWGMPRRVAEAGLADAVLPLPALAGALLQRVQVGRELEKQRQTMQLKPVKQNRHEVMYGML